MKNTSLIVFFSLLLVSCAAKRIVVTGTALNAKLGPMIFVSEDSVYYVYELGEWNDSIVNRNVTVSGRLKVIKHDFDSTYQSVKIEPILKRTVLISVE